MQPFDWLERRTTTPTAVSVMSSLFSPTVAVALRPHRRVEQRMKANARTRATPSTHGGVPSAGQAEWSFRGARATIDGLRNPAPVYICRNGSSGPSTSNARVIVDPLTTNAIQPVSGDPLPFPRKCGNQDRPRRRRVARHARCRRTAWPVRACRAWRASRTDE